jgi:hypothetical protein
MTTLHVCVIAQQYSSSTFAHCALIPAKRNWALLKNAVSLNYSALLRTFQRLKLRNLKLRKSGSACNKIASTRSNLSSYLK